MSIPETTARAARATNAEHVLRLVAEGIAPVRGEQFFRVLVRLLAMALDVRIAFASEFTDSKTRVRTLAYWDRDHFGENFEYDLEGTPCEAVLNGEIAYYPNAVQECFPRDREELAALGAESYLAIPMRDYDGEVLGHLAAIDDKPMPDNVVELSALQILGCRAALELERQRTANLLEKSEKRLSNVLGSAMDAILTIDSRHHITLFNRAAEQMFRCSANWAISQPIERFLPPKFRKIVSNYLAEASSPDHRQLWAPEGLTALRADGDEFPVEGTISPLQVDSEMLHTIILRDIKERERAQAEVRRLQEENLILHEEIRRRQHFGELITEAPEMERVLVGIEQVAPTDTTVLITGETGTGKELVARAIHNAGARAERTLVPVNCAALPGELIESELFGHERGAFTGATNQRKGRFELAHGGTIFLDEVGELTAQAQAKLLRVLQEKQFERVGGTQPIRVDVRVIAATNRNLEEMVKDGRFRADLFYRLNVFPIRVPPLRERPDDVAPLARHFLELYSRKLGKGFTGIAPLALDRLRRYAWPGNVRELQNVVERGVILCEGPLFEISDPLLAPGAAGDSRPATVFGGTLEDSARQHIQQVLAQCKGVVEGPQGAAAVLGLKPSTLRYRMKQLGIGKPARA